MRTGLLRLPPAERRIVIARVAACLKIKRKCRIAALRRRIDAMIMAERLHWWEIFPEYSHWRQLDAGIPKYCHPTDPWRTWSGHGRPPRWLTEALKTTGASLHEFRISAASTGIGGHSARLPSALSSTPLLLVPDDVAHAVALILDYRQQGIQCRRLVIDRGAEGVEALPRNG